MPDPPYRPNYLQVINYVTDVWAQPCEAPWYIYVETLGPAALQALITLATFGWDDVFRGAVRPKSLRSRKFKARAFRIGGKVVRFPEIGELIGKHLPGAKYFQGTKYAMPTRHLWRIDGILQRGLFYWLIADIASDFTFNWTSALYETEWCKATLQARHSNIGRPFQLGVAGGSWHELNCPSEDYSIGDVSFAVHTWVMGAGHFRFGAAALFFDYTFEGGRARLRLRELPSGIVHDMSEWASWEPFESATPVTIGRGEPGKRYVVEWAAETPSGLVKIDERVAFAAAEIP